MNFFVVLSLCTALNSADQVSAPAFITAINGEVQIFRASNVQTIPAEIDIGLFNGDSLKTGADGQATIVYSNGKILSISKGTVIEITNLPVDTTTRGGTDIDAGVPPAAPAAALFSFNVSGERIAIVTGVRGPEDSTNVVIYEPGNTALPAGKPNFIWSKHPAADSYTVVCQKSGKPVWHFTTADTVLPYPAQQAELVPGSYLLKVIVRRDSDTLNFAERFFKILKPEKVALINKALDNIKAQNPDSFTLHFLSAKIFEQEYMVLSAIHEYEELLKINPAVAFIHGVLSELYNKYGLPKIGNLHDDRFRQLTGQK